MQKNILDEIINGIAPVIKKLSIDMAVKESDKYTARIAELEKTIEGLNNKLHSLTTDAKSTGDLILSLSEDIEKSQSSIPELISEAVQKAVEAIPAPKDGTSVTIEDVQPLISEAVQKAVEAIPAPKDGTSVTIEDVQPLISEAVQKAVEAIPAPKDGKDAEVDYDYVTQIVDKTLQEAVSKINIPIPKDGQDGKDALELEILPEIDEDKSYARGTFACHRGGVWRSYQRTSGMKGWECIMDGLFSQSVDYDGQRKAVIRIEKSSGEVTEEALHIPAILHKGVWKEGRYEKGDCVQLSGSSWIAVEDNEERPGEGSKAWICSAKRGGTGESAYDTARKAGFKGSKSEWLETLGKKSTVKVTE